MIENHYAIIKKVIELTKSKILKWQLLQPDKKILSLLEIGDDMMNGDFVYQTSYNSGFFYFVFYYGAYRLMVQANQDTKVDNIDATYQDELKSLFMLLKDVKSNPNDEFVKNFLDD